MNFCRPGRCWLLTLLIAAVCVERSGAASLPATAAIVRLQVAVVTDEVSIRRGAKVISANLGDFLQAGDRLDTGATASVVLVATNGVDLSLGPNTSLIIEDVGSLVTQPRFTFDHGEIFMAIHHLAASTSPFVVTTSIGSVSSIGARIRLTYNEAADEIKFSCACIEGGVTFHQINHEPVRIRQGSMGTVVGPKAQLTTFDPVPFSPEEMAMWVQTFQRLIIISAAVRAR
jgi:hypothetical protein